MNKDLATTLKQEAEKIATQFSNKERENNYNNEVFQIDEIIPLSDTTAIALYIKKPTLKKALAFFYHRNGKQTGWYYFFPTDSHILGLREIEKYKSEIEKYNFKYNFD